MDQKQIDSLREKVKAALPAPWVYEVVEAGEWIRSIAAASHNDQADIVCGELRAEWSPEWQCLPSDENASLIVSAINALPDLLTLAEQALSPIGDGEVAEVVQALQSIRGEQELKDVGWFGVMSKAANLLTRLSSQLHQARSELERTADARSRADFAYDNAIKSARADHEARARRLSADLEAATGLLERAMQLLSDDVEELPPVGYIEGVESLETDWRKFRFSKRWNVPISSPKAKP